MSLFAAVFGEAPHASVGGLFSASNKFAAHKAAQSEHQGDVTKQTAQQQQEAAGGGKKRRRQDGAAALAEEQQQRGKKPKGKAKKQAEQQQQQKDSEAAAPASQQQTKAQAAARSKPAAPTPAAKKAAAPPAAADPRLPRTVFVGNLPADVKRKALARLFAPCGAVESVRLRSLPLKLEPGSKVPRRGAIASGSVDAEHSGHAYVVFEQEGAVEAALKLNMAEVGGRRGGSRRG